MYYCVISVQEEGQGHGYACEGDVGREALADASGHEEETHEPGQSGSVRYVLVRRRGCGPLLVSVYDPGCYCTNIGAGADDEQDDEEEGLKVEERGLHNVSHHFFF